MSTGANREAFNNVDLDIDQGQVLGLIGETGCGKSVLGMSILRLLPPNGVSRGQIIYKYRDLLGLSPQVMQRIRGSRNRFATTESIGFAKSCFISWAAVDGRAAPAPDD
ncbi:MAG: ATP-binding cassette domain-containing protein [Candidatus Syntrophopropionicum ammoniitolerans]